MTLDELLEETKDPTNPSSLAGTDINAVLNGTLKRLEGHLKEEELFLVRSREEASRRVV